MKWEKGENNGVWRRKVKGTVQRVPTMSRSVVTSTYSIPLLVPFSLSFSYSLPHFFAPHVRALVGCVCGTFRHGIVVVPLKKRSAKKCDHCCKAAQEGRSVGVWVLLPLRIPKQSKSVWCLNGAPFCLSVCWLVSLRAGVCLNLLLRPFYLPIYHDISLSLYL